MTHVDTYALPGCIYTYWLYNGISFSLRYAGDELTAYCPGVGEKSVRMNRETYCMFLEQLKRK